MVENETSREAEKVLTQSKADVFSSVEALIAEALHFTMVASLKPQYRKRQVSASPRDAFIIIHVMLLGRGYTASMTVVTVCRSSHS
jgi:hypothetical protein